MAKIHWLVYVLVGLFVVISSYMISYDKLIFFFYLGWIFVCIGIVKMAIGFDKNKSESHQKIHQTQQYKYCKKCRNILRFHDRFCGRCGAKT